jgi:predicted nucleotidyltransferase
MTRLDRFNARAEYVYGVKSAVLFGSMLSDAERLGDVDIAIELEAKMADEAVFNKLCDARRKLAMRRGKCFRSTVDWAYWPRMEVFSVLRARSRALSLHEWDQVVRIPKVRYRVLFGNRRRIVGMIAAGDCVDAA